jgi:hypothetical protein
VIGDGILAAGGASIVAEPFCTTNPMPPLLGVDPVLKKFNRKRYQPGEGLLMNVGAVGVTAPRLFQAVMRELSSSKIAIMLNALAAVVATTDVSVPVAVLE